MKDRKDILVAAGAGIALVSVAVLIFAASALAGGINPQGQIASDYGANNDQGQACCPIANGISQDATGDSEESYNDACH